MTSPAARRKRQDRRDAANAHRDGLREFHKLAMRGGGVFETCVVRGEDVLAMTFSASSTHQHMVRSIAHWLAEAHEAREADKPLCLACEHAFSSGGRWPLAFVISKTLGNEPYLIITGVCPRCASAKTDDDLLAAAGRGFRKIGLVREDAP